MPQEDRITKIKICHALWRNGVSPEAIAPQLGLHRATVYRWTSGIRRVGVREFVRRYKNAKKGRKRPRRTDALTKARVYAAREKYRKCCGEKIRHFLLRDHGSSPCVSTIYRILREKYELRSRWKKNLKRGAPFRKAERPRQYVQADTVDFGGVYAHTAIDIYTKEPSVVLVTSLEAAPAAEALERHLAFFGEIDGIQRDGGPEFKKEWDALARERIPKVRTARPYRKNEQAFIERFNGILRKECLGYGPYKPKDIPELQKRLDAFLHYYLNERPHLSLGMKTPREFAMSHLT
jgi:IS30 family transposase